MNKKAPVMRIVASFKLFVKCQACLHDSTKTVNVPDVEDAPTTIDDLMTSQLLQSVEYCCRRCDGRSAKIVAVKVVPLECEAA